MEKLAKNQIREIAADVFGRYPRANSIAVTADGQAFITDDGDAAVKNHARTNRYKEQLEITAFHRSEFEEKPEEKPKNTPPKAAVVAATVQLGGKTTGSKKAVPAGKKTATSPALSAVECPPPDVQVTEPKESEQPKKEEQ